MILRPRDLKSLQSREEAKGAFHKPGMFFDLGGPTKIDSPSTMMKFLKSQFDEQNVNGMQRKNGLIRFNTNTGNLDEISASQMILVPS